MLSIFKPVRVLALVALAVALTGCAGDPAMVAPAPPLEFHRLGMVDGTSCGMLFLATPPTSFIPVGLSGRAARAYENALEEIPGTAGLIDVTMREDWVWLVVGTLRCTTIKGEAVQ